MSMTGDMSFVIVVAAIKDVVMRLFAGKLKYYLFVYFFKILNFFQPLFCL
jgi:hypothetical protein